MKVQSEAEQNLASFSQFTSYISDWRELSPKRIRKPQKNKETIREEEPESRPNKRYIANRQPSEKYDLKKWEQKIKSLNHIEYPILDKKDLFAHEQSYVLPKTRFSGHNYESATLPAKKRSDFSNRIRNLIEDKVKERKYQHLKKKLLQKKEDEIKSPLLPRFCKLKRKARDSSKQECFISRPLMPARQLKELKKKLQKENRKFSLPNLMKIQDQHPHSSGALQHR